MNQNTKESIFASLKKKLEQGLEISEGWKNYMFPTPYTEALSKMRLEECSKCPNFDTSGTSCVVPGTYPCCSLCGCPLLVKTCNPNSNCPENKWDKILIDKEI